LKVSYFHFFFITLIIIFSCHKSKKKHNDFEITIEKKRVDSINFQANVIVRDKSNIDTKDKVYILIDKEGELNSKIKILKENFLQKKEGSD
tara:strand:- start:2336 stop:2608 length:273 start_codon:yes stop_codon:yes gene_type:complete